MKFDFLSRNIYNNKPKKGGVLWKKMFFRKFAVV